jgi:hypothetical protein
MLPDCWERNETQDRLIQSRWSPFFISTFFVLLSYFSLSFLSLFFFLTTSQLHYSSFSHSVLLSSHICNFARCLNSHSLLTSTLSLLLSSSPHPLTNNKQHTFNTLASSNLAKNSFTLTLIINFVTNALTVSQQNSNKKL